MITNNTPMFTRGNPVYGQNIDRLYANKYAQRIVAYDNFMTDFTKEFFKNPDLLKNRIRTAILAYQGKIQQSLRYRLFKKNGLKRSAELLQNIDKATDNESIIKLISNSLQYGNEDQHSFKTMLVSHFINGFKHKDAWAVNVKLFGRKAFLNDFTASYAKMHAQENIELNVMQPAQR